MEVRRLRCSEFASANRYSIISSARSDLGAVFMHKAGRSTVERAGFLDRPTLTGLIVAIGLTIGLFALLHIGFLAP